MGYDDNEYQDALRQSRRRKKRAMVLKKKRQAILKKRIMMAMAVAFAIILAVFIVNAARGIKKSSKATEAVVDSYQGETEAESVTEVETTTAFAYSTIASNYIDLSSNDNIKSQYAALLDVDNNTIIAGKGATTRIYPASMTKVMTLIVVSEHLDDIDETFTFTNELIWPLVKEEASRAGFDAGEVVDVEDLLYGLILPSGADSAEALAIMVAGSNEEFAKLMNAKCKELGLKNTNFANPTGLFDANQYTTPQEMAMILEYAMRDEYRAKILGTYQYTTKATPQHPEGIPLTSTMYSRIYGNEAPGVLVTGGKTGYISEAGSCLVSYAVTNKGHAYVFCTGGASYMWAPIYDEIYAYKTLIPDSEKNLNTESTTSVNN